MNTIAASGDTAPLANKAGSGSALRSRILSALILAPLVMAGIVVGFPLFDILIAAASVIMAAEWRRLCGGKILDLVGGVMIAAALAGIGAVVLGHSTAAVLLVLFGAAIASILSAAIGEERRVLLGCGLGAALVGGCGISLVWLRLLEPGGFAIIVWLVLAIWLTDICAFFSGRAIGGPKLAPAISPNKTWAGLIGGVAAAAVWSVVWGGWQQVESLVAMALIGAATAVLAQLGDLGVSVVKRRFGAKDSGSLIPGHGGFLDRMDGFIGAAPPVALAIAINGFGGLPWL